MAKPTFDPVDTAAGALFVVLGAGFAWFGRGLEIGTAFRMGPGYFPLVLAGLLMLLGLIIIAGGVRGNPQEITGAAWRGMLFILPAPVFFGLTIQGLGFVPTVFLTTLIAAFASLRLRWPVALALAVGMTVFATVVFSYGLGLPFRRFGPWIGG
jgi:hypothetical protein